MYELFPDGSSKGISCFAGNVNWGCTVFCANEGVCAPGPTKPYPYDTSQRDYIFEEDRFLVNLETDPGERTNLALQHPDIVKKLEKQYNEWLKKQLLATNAPLTLKTK